MAIDRVHKRFVFYHKAGGTGLSLATVRVGLSVHEYIFSFDEATCLFSSDLKTAAVSR